MITQKETLLHWNYFFALESDLENLSRYIEFSRSNFHVYSIKLVHLLFAAASEIDVLAKEICEFLDPQAKAENISDYRVLITGNLPGFSREKVFVPRYGLDITPWSKCVRGENPS